MGKFKSTPSATKNPFEALCRMKLSNAVKIIAQKIMEDSAINFVLLRTSNGEAGDYVKLVTGKWSGAFFNSYSVKVEITQTDISVFDMSQVPKWVCHRHFAISDPKSIQNATDYIKLMCLRRGNEN